MRIGFDYDDTIDEHVSSFQLQRSFLIRALSGMIAIRELFIISARKNNNNNRAEILAYMEKIHVPFSPDNLFLGYSGEKKAKLAEDLGIRIFFDDDAIVVASMIEKRIDAFLVGTFLNKGYRNAWREVTPSNILALYPEERRNG